MIKRKKYVTVLSDGTIEMFIPFSSSIERLAWIDNSLAVQFVNKSKYKYENVPIEIVQQLAVSFSPGSDFDSLVKKGGYKYTRL